LELIPGRPRRLVWNADRFVTRFVSYPIQLLRSRERFDFFHIADHTYAQLVYALPRGKVGVFCHDLDAFEPVLDGEGLMSACPIQGARVLLEGLKRAAVVFFSTQQVGERILAHRIVDKERLVHAPYGLADEFWHPMDADLPDAVRGLPYL